MGGRDESKDENIHNNVNCHLSFVFLLDVHPHQKRLGSNVLNVAPTFQPRKVQMNLKG